MPGLRGWVLKKRGHCLTTHNTVLTIPKQCRNRGWGRLGLKGPKPLESLHSSKGQARSFVFLNSQEGPGGGCEGPWPGRGILIGIGRAQSLCHWQGDTIAGPWERNLLPSPSASIPEAKGSCGSEEKIWHQIELRVVIIAKHSQFWAEIVFT